MDNCVPNSDTQAAPAQAHDHANQHRHVDVQADIASAKLAWESWKSSDPKDWDHALAEKQRLLKEDPKAWKKAMNEIDADEKAQADARDAERARQVQADVRAEVAGQASAAEPAPLNKEYLNETAPPLVSAENQLRNVDAASASNSADAPVAVAQPGYSPDSPFAPAAPDTPAYNAAYNQPAAKFYGLNLGIIKLGVNSHGSIDAGVNIGLARAEVQVGLENRVDGEFMPVGHSPLHARVGAGVGVNRNGFHGEAGAGLNVFNLVGGDADVGARLGRDIGFDGDLRGRALLVNGQGEAGVSLGPDGLNAHGGGNADILKTVGARGGGRVNLGPQDTGIAAGVGMNVAGNTLDFGPSIDAYPNGTVAPDLHLDPGKVEAPAFFPTGDRTLDQK